MTATVMLCTVLIFLWVFRPTYSDKIDDNIAKFPEDQKECHKKYPVSNKIMENFANLRLVKDKTFMEYCICLVMKQGLISSNGQWDFSRVVAIYQRIFKENPPIKAVNCEKHINLHNHKEYMWQLLTCLQKEFTRDQFTQFVRKYWILVH